MARKVQVAENGDFAGLLKHKVWSAGWESWADRLCVDLVYSLRRLSHAKALVLAVVGVQVV